MGLFPCQTMRLKMSKIDFTCMIGPEAVAEARLGAARVAASAQVTAHVEAQIQALTSFVPLEEKLLWGVKADVARQILRDKSAVPDVDAVALLEAEAMQTGETLTELADRILAKADRHRLVIAELTGWRRKLLRQIAEASDEAQVAAVVAAGLAEAPCERVVTN